MVKQSGIENTTATMTSLRWRCHPLDTLPGMIEASERHGQADLVKSESLPSEVHDRETFEALGFTFGAPFKDDPLFAPATLPAGWTKRATDHAMWSEIVDDKGRES